MPSAAPHFQESKQPLHSLHHCLQQKTYMVSLRGFRLFERKQRFFPISQRRSDHERHATTKVDMVGKDS